MKRTQVYLTEEQDQRLKARALREKKPVAMVLREAVDKGLEYGAPKVTARDALLGLTKLAEGLDVDLPPDLSINHDEYLYGDKEW